MLVLQGLIMDNFHFEKVVMDLKDLTFSIFFLGGCGDL